MAADSPALDGVILGLLIERPLSGYDMLAHFRDPAALGMVWQMSASQVYAVLKRLERLGCVASERAANEHGPDRVLYTISEHGRKVLQNWLDAEPGGSVRRVRVEFLSRVWIAQRMNLPVALLRERQLAACQQSRDLLCEQANTLPVGSVGRAAAELILAELDVVMRWLKDGEQISGEQKS